MIKNMAKNYNQFRRNEIFVVKSVSSWKMR